MATFVRSVSGHFVASAKEFIMALLTRSVAIATFLGLLVILTAPAASQPVPAPTGEGDPWWTAWFGEAAPSSQLLEDEKLLQAAKMPTDGPGLLKALRNLVPAADDEKQVKALFEQLGSAKFQ